MISMSSTSKLGRRSALLLAAFFFSPSLSFATTATPPGSSVTIGDSTAVLAQNMPYSNASYPQTVRVSLVVGDVRVSRGKENEKATGATWEQAAANLPLASGFSLVTGQGHAEIEFEDASTVYLGENSVLALNDLTTTAGVPRTQITLLSGTATLHVHPDIPQEQFVVNTPAGNLAVRYGKAVFIRIDSYLDAMAVTPLGQDAIFHLPNGGQQQQALGQTIVYNHGRRIVATEHQDTAQLAATADWDKWVTNRATVRDAAMDQVMAQSGLDGPIAGMAEMQDQGSFFPCAPYGTCWLPSASQAAGSNLLLHTEYDEPFPCSPDQVRYLIGTDPVTGKDRILSTTYEPGAMPYAWAVCHAGTWINRQNRYVWVAGRRRHHRCPVRWVKSGRSTGYVPIHPHDIKDKPPINLKYGLFSAKEKDNTFEHIAFDASKPVKLLEAPPREFRKEYFPPLNRAEAPKLEARSLREPLPGSKDFALNHATISFDHKSQSFMLARQVTEGNKTIAHVEPFGGSLQRGGGAGFSGGHSSFNGGNNSGGSRGGYSGGGASGGHSSGGGGAGGGGGHSGGGGGSSGGGGGGGGGGGHK